MTMESQPGFVTVAMVMKTQGRVGEVAAVLLTNFPARFAERKRLFALDKHSQRREMELEDHWFHKGQVVLKFAGVDDINGAEELIGCEIQVCEGERTPLQDGSIYVSDLIGCMVSDSGQEIGRIADVQFSSGEAPLLVVKGQKEYLIPFAGEYLESVALAEKQIWMKLPPGMLELDAPLSREEKQRQKQED
jgi:16S rRNA processing protein RimM